MLQTLLLNHCMKHIFPLSMRSCLTQEHKLRMFRTYNSQKQLYKKKKKTDRKKMLRNITNIAIWKHCSCYSTADVYRGQTHASFSVRKVVNKHFWLVCEIGKISEYRLSREMWLMANTDLRPIIAASLVLTVKVLLLICGMVYSIIIHIYSITAQMFRTMF